MERRTNVAQLIESLTETTVANRNRRESLLRLYDALNEEQRQRMLQDATRILRESGPGKALE